MNSNYNSDESVIGNSLHWTSSENEATTEYKSSDEDSLPVQKLKSDKEKSKSFTEKSKSVNEKSSKQLGYSSSEDEVDEVVARRKKKFVISSDESEPDPDKTIPPYEKEPYDEGNLTQQFHDLTVRAKSTPNKDKKKKNTLNHDHFVDSGSSGIVLASTSQNNQSLSVDKCGSVSSTLEDSPSVIQDSFEKTSVVNRKSYRSPQVIVLDSDSETENDIHSIESSSGASDMDSLRTNLKAKKLSLEQNRTLKQKQVDILKASMRSIRMQDLPDGGHKLNSSLEKESKELSDIEREIDIVDVELQSLPPESAKNASQSYAWSALPKSNVNLSEMGKRALATHHAQQAITMEALTGLTKSLETCPKEEDESEDPVGLKVELLLHQKQALTWMLWRERQKPAGGILADDMGLGKTLTMISLILKSIEEKKARKQAIGEENTTDDEEATDSYSHKRTIEGKTLVVCPSSVMGQWEKEIKSKVSKGLLYCVLHHGPKRDTKPHRLAVYDVVVTSFTIVQKDRKDEKLGPLLSMKWERVILDEAHYIRNHKCQTSEAVYLIKAKHRWCLTGTPIQNKTADFYSLLKFLKCKPFDDLNVWKKWVENNDAAGIQRLNYITKTLLLRRTKESILSSGKLPLKGKELSVIKVKMDKNENDVYEKVAHFSSTLLAQLVYQKAEKEHLLSGGVPHLKKEHWKNENPFKNHPELCRLHENMVSMGNVKTHEILVLLLRLRQICCHPSLVTSMLDKNDMNGESVEDEDGLDIDLFDRMMNMSLAEEPKPEDTEVVPKNIFSLSNPVFKRDRPSSKVREVINCLKENVLKGGKDKAVVVSQWSSVLEIIHEFLKKEDVWCISLTGKVPVKDRPKIIEQFNNDPLGAQVLLLSLNAGGTGLNLVGGNHLLLVDVHWNPQLEIQACDRVYRVGQKKDVYIYKFVCMDTIEEQIMKLQEDKMNIAQNVLSGSANVPSSKLTLQDLKLLFNIP